MRWILIISLTVLSLGAEVKKDITHIGQRGEWMNISILFFHK